jgi:predicted phage replisome organizer/uncharacterized phage protein (TIGR02220 family)
MSIKWIKITTTMFDDEKIDFIESLPEADALLVIWIKLLTLAGKCNAGGYILLTENIPYTDEMLAHKFRRPINTVRLALQTFQRLKMVTIDEEARIYITNWEKHQNVDGLERIRERERLKKQRQRQKLKEQQMKLELPEECPGTVPGTDEGHVPQCPATDIDKEIDKEKEKIKIPFSEIIDYLNEKAGTSYKATTKKTRDLIQARWNEGFGLDAFKKVIDNKVAEWLDDPYWSKYLRPETLFSNKFEGYLNQKTIRKGRPANGGTSGLDPDRERQYRELGLL